MMNNEQAAIELSEIMTKSQLESIEAILREKNRQLALEILKNIRKNK